MMQRAYVLTHWKKHADGTYYAAIVDNATQAGEGVTMVRDFWWAVVPTTQHVLIVEVIADSARLDLLNGSVHYVFSRANLDETASGKELNQPLSALEVTALSAWLVAKTGRSQVAIANWFGLTALQLSNWLQNNPRREAAEKLITAWLRY